MGLPDPGAAVAIPRHRFTVGDFARLGEAGIFTEDDRVELIVSTAVAGLQVTVDEIVGRGDDGRR